MFGVMLVEDGMGEGVLFVVVVVVALLFYVHGKHLRSCRDGWSLITELLQY